MDMNEVQILVSKLKGEQDKADLYRYTADVLLEANQKDTFEGRKNLLHRKGSCGLSWTEVRLSEVAIEVAQLTCNQAVTIERLAHVFRELYEERKSKAERLKGKLLEELSWEKDNE